MVKVEIISLGKTKEKWLNVAIEEYRKRLEKLCKIELTFLKESKSRSINGIIEEESEKILALLNEKYFYVLLDSQGVSYSSEKFSQFFETRMNQGDSKIVFLIGGAYGFNQALKDKVAFQLSLSQFTFTHQLSRLICIEQIYRALSILGNLPYHH